MVSRDSSVVATSEQASSELGGEAVHIETGQVVAFLKEEDAVQELFAVQVLPGIRFPEMLDRDEEHLATAVVLPDEALADVPPPRLNHSKFTGEKPLNS